MKHCIKCPEPKLNTEYHKNKNNPDGLKNICKECTKIESSDRNYWKKNNPESYAKFHFNRKQFIKDNFPNVNYRSVTAYIARCRDFKLSDLSREDVIQVVNDWISVKRY
jgi:hypothetical protein